MVIVHGFDVRRENTSAFDELLERTKPLTDSLGLRVHVVRTDVREQLQQDWEDAHGALLAAILHQFSDRFEYGLIGSTNPYRYPLGAWGSLPTTDYLLSGGDFEIVHEGAGFTKTEKVGLIAGNPIARRAVKVCWEGPDRGPQLRRLRQVRSDAAALHGRGRPGTRVLRYAFRHRQPIVAGAPLLVQPRDHR